MALKIANESSLSFEGVGKVLRSVGGGIGLRGLLLNRGLEAEDPGRGLMGAHLPADIVDPALGLPPGPLCIDIPPDGRRCLGPGMGRLLLGGGVMALRVTGAA